MISKFAAEKFAKKLLGDSEIEATVQRLDRLTQDEARMTVAQTLGVVHGLVGNVKVIMEGAQMLARSFSGKFLTFVPLDRETSMDSIRHDLGILFARNKYHPC